MIFPYAIEEHQKALDIVREARLTILALKLAREMETGPVEIRRVKLHKINSETGRAAA